MDMHFLTFDRLSKALVIGGAGLFTLGLAIAFLKAHRAHDTDSAMFWICTIVTIVALAMVVGLTCNEANVRVAGLGFQVAGILVALYALQDVRIKLDRPGLIPTLSAFVETPFRSQPDNRIGEGMVLEAASISKGTGNATLTTNPKPLSTEDRFKTLEDRAQTLEKIHAADIAALRMTIQDIQQNALERHREQVAAVSNVKRLIVDLQTSGLPLALFAIVWLLIGSVLASLSIEVAGGIARLQR